MQEMPGALNNEIANIVPKVFSKNLFKFNTTKFWYLSNFNW